MSGPSRQHPSRAQWLRRLAQRRRDRVAFVFSGGGPLGALQVGALRALFEAGIRPEIAVGTSVGALNATFVAFEPTPEGIQRLERVWLSITDGDLFPGGRFRPSWTRMLSRGNKVFDSSGLRRLITSRLPHARFEEAQLPLGIVATDLETGEERIFASGPILEPLLASAAMPGVYPPIEIDGRQYIDGGVSDNVPIAPAVALGARTLYVMNSTSHSHQRRPLQRPMDYLLHAFTLARSQRLAIDQQTYAEKVKLVMLPTVPLDFFVPFASMAHTAQLIAAGYEETKRFLRGHVTTATDGDVEVIGPAK